MQRVDECRSGVTGDCRTLGPSDSGGDAEGAPEAILGCFDHIGRERPAVQEVGDFVALDRRQNAADDGDAERAAHLTRRVVDR